MSPVTVWSSCGVTYTWIAPALVLLLETLLVIRWFSYAVVHIASVETVLQCEIIVTQSDVHWYMKT